MHPICSLLLSEMKFSTHQHPLKMSMIPTPSTTTTGKSNMNSLCRMCMRRRTGCVYHCTSCSYTIHAVCARNLINGLHANGIHPPDKPNKFGKVAKVASHAFLEFLGGLIEGLGEGIGGALISGIGKGKGRNNGVVTS